MKTKFVLRLCGIDLRDPDAYDRLGPDLAEIHFSATGELSLATVLVEGPDSPAAAVAAARLIETSAHGVTVAGVYRERVGLSEIAERLGVGREAVRLWSTGRRRSKRSFPAPHDVALVGGRVSNQYSWAEVLHWARGEGLAEESLGGVRDATVEELAELELLLERPRESRLASHWIFGEMRTSMKLEIALAALHTFPAVPDHQGYRRMLLRSETVHR